MKAPSIIAMPLAMPMAVLVMTIVGGLVGDNFDYIRNSYATGNTTGGTGGDSVGGLVGLNEGSIDNSYATGNANGNAGNDNVGGLVGHADNTTDDVIISNSYSLGDVDGGDGDDGVGRLLGVKGTGTRNTITITSNYYNSDSQLNNGEIIEELTGTNEATGRTKAQLKAINLDLPIIRMLAKQLGELGIPLHVLAESSWLECIQLGFH